MASGIQQVVFEAVTGHGSVMQSVAAERTATSDQSFQTQQALAETGAMDESGLMHAEWGGGMRGMEMNDAQVQEAGGQAHQHHADESMATMKQAANLHAGRGFRGA